MSEEKQRLSKVMAAAGVASRRKCEEIIFAGRVQVNGEESLLPQTMVGSGDVITVDGQMISLEKKVYLIMNKPKGYVCSTIPTKRSRSIMTLFDHVPERLFTVGRLDKDTEGLLLLTNDGHFANRVIHPSSNIEKEYVAVTDSSISDAQLKKIAGGAEVEGIFVKPLTVKRVGRDCVHVVVGEGKKREVRVLIANAGLGVTALTRVRIGGLKLENLPVGRWRAMTEKEKKAIFI
ncbi:MAG: rRNA pseudouridine synthase [Chlamydiales bacterium]|nr:rRNA pseudouridine synthase [Chlamydiia bacterium]MCP5507803.1 rRNA pseudouridine synthase [Chlamydiales bacterium]